MNVAIKSSPTASLNNNARWKRKGSDNEEERCGENIKKAKFSWYVTLESESLTQIEEDKESVYTVQGNETEFAHDTSDTSTNSWINSNASDISDDVEYELDSQSENETPFMEISSCSEPENILPLEFITFCDSEAQADDSDGSKSSINSDIRKVNFLLCVQCRSVNKNPLFPYCEKCYQARKLQFSRSRSKRKPRMLKDQKKNSPIKMKISKCLDLAQDLSEIDSGLPSSQDMDKSVSDSQSSDTSEMNLTNIQRSILPYNSPMSESEIIQSSIIKSKSIEGNEVYTGVAIRTMNSYPLLSDCGTSRLNYAKEEAEADNLKLCCNNTDMSLPISMQVQSFKSDQFTAVATIPNNQTETNQNTQDLESLCLICTVNPKNGAFMHSKITHICCCYDCAIKVWKSNNNRCPICNRRVTQVLKAFYV